MATFHIVFALGAVRTAEDLGQLLADDGHTVSLFSGRIAVLALGSPPALDTFVIVVWSAEAESQPYVAEWAARTDPDRLVELAVSTPYPPKVQRKAPVIDFTNWRGERGGRAWNAFTERLRTVTREAEVAKAPPRQAAAALAAMGALVIGGGVMVRIEEPRAPEVAYAPEPAPVYTAPTGVGGSELASLLEPLSVEETFGTARLPPRVAPLTRYQPASLDEAEPLEPVELRNPTLVERILDLNPLRPNRGRRDS